MFLLARTSRVLFQASLMPSGSSLVREEINHGNIRPSIAIDGPVFFREATA